MPTPGPADDRDSDYEEAPILANVGSRRTRVAMPASTHKLAARAAMELATTAQHNPSAFFALKDRSHLDSQEPLPNIKHEYLEANGIRIHAVSLGRQPHKPLMLFLHGFPEFWYSWRHQLRHYSRDYDAVAIDMRGYGLSDKPPGVDSYRLDVLAADVAAVIEALGHERCVLVADDWGAAVSWVVAGMYPHRVHRLVTLSGLHTGLAVVNASQEQREKSWYIALFQVPHVAELFCTHSDMQFIAEMFTPGTAWGPVSRTTFTETDREWYKWAFSQPGTVNAGLNYYRAYTKHMTNEPIPEVWRALKRRLHMPVLVIMGANDVAFTVQSIENLDQVAPLSEVYVLEGCSHWVACEQPLKVIELMDKFMDKYPAQAPQHSHTLSKL